MGTSIRAGISGAEILGCEGAIIALADQPHVTADIFRKLIEEHEETNRPVIASEYAGTVGAPAFFARELFPNLKSPRRGTGRTAAARRGGRGRQTLSAPFSRRTAERSPPAADLRRRARAPRSPRRPRRRAGTEPLAEKLADRIVLERRRAVQAADQPPRLDLPRTGFCHEKGLRKNGWGAS